jgi:hypothetical protein
VSSASTQSIADRLIEACESASDGATQWLARVRAEASGPFDENRFLAAYSGAARRLRSGRCLLDDAFVGELAERGIRGAGSWTPVRAVRTGLVLAALEAAEWEGAGAIARKVFRTGDNEERIALLGALVLAKDPAAFLELAIDACRTHVTEVFEAIACDNAYPARYFPEANFNQMILKAVFIEVPLERVVGLGDRLNVELCRMAEYYAEERTAAGRTVPADLRLLTTASG